MATGWQKLGEMLAGGGGGDEAYRARMMENARMGTALGQDRALRLKEAALLGLDEALIGLGNTPQQAGGLGALGRAGLNPEQFTGAGIDLGTRRAQDAAFAAVQQGGGLEAAAPYLALQEGKAIPTVDIKGDTVFNPYGTLDQALVPTPLGEARIGERNAAAGAQDALDWRRRNAPLATGGAGAAGGAAGEVRYDGPTVAGPRGIVMRSSGNKTLDKELYTRTQADLEIIDTINDIRAVAGDERNFGAVGKLRGTMQDLIQQGNALAQQFEGKAAQIRDEIQSGAHDVDLGLFSTDLPAITYYNNVLAFKLAKSLDPSGRISNEDVRIAAEAIGSPQALLGNREKYLASLKAMEDQTLRRLEEIKAKPVPLGNAMSPPGALQSDSVERAIAKLESEEGPLPEQVKAQLRTQMMNGGGDFNVANPAAAPTGTQRRIRYDAQGNRIP